MRLVAVVLSLIMLVPASFADFLANDTFIEPALLGPGQTQVGSGQVKAIHPLLANAIRGIPYWKHASILNAGISRQLPFDYPSLWIKDADRYVQQESDIPVQTGQNWKVNGLIYIPSEGGGESRAGKIELWSGSISSTNPEQLNAGAVLLNSYTVATPAWPGVANRRVSAGTEVSVGFSYTASAGSPALGKNLVLRLVLGKDSDGPVRWFLGRLTLDHSGGSATYLSFAEGNRGCKISGFLPTGPGSSAWTVPAPWEESTQSLRIADVYSPTWVMLPAYATGNGAGLASISDLSVQYRVFPRSYFGSTQPVAAIVTANGTYYASEPFVSPNTWTTISKPLLAKYWLKNHYLIGTQVSQAQFAWDLLTTQSIHVMASFGGGPTDTSISNAGINGGTSGGLTVNCSVIPDGYLGTFGINAGERQARIIQYDQGVQVGLAQLTGSFSGGGGIGLSGAVPGTYRTYSDGDRFLRTDCGSVTIPAEIGLPVLGQITLRNGDCDNDGAVSVFDYIFLSDAFDSVPGNAAWDARADLDGDAVISIFDYIILSDRFDQSDD